MKKRIIICFFTALLLTGTGFNGFTQTSELKNVQEGVKGFSEDIAKALPFNSSLGLNWADAYIGKLLPSAPPHFGVGVSMGATTMDPSSLEKLGGYLGTDLSLGISKMPIPAYTAEARIGGLFLPFDIGFKFGYLPPMNIMEVKLDYLMVGGDIRFAVLDGKTNKILPNVSLGAGVNYLKGGVGGSIGEAQTINTPPVDTTFLTIPAHSIKLSSPDVKLEWENLSLDLKAQISKSFLIITPYLGFGGSYSFAKAGYSVKADVKVDGKDVSRKDIDDINGYLTEYGLDPVDIDSNGISSFIKNNAFNFRAYGGFSLNLLVFRLDLTGLYNVMDQNFGASLGLRFQL